MHPPTSDNIEGSPDFSPFLTNANIDASCHRTHQGANRVVCVAKESLINISNICRAVADTIAGSILLRWIVCVIALQGLTYPLTLPFPGRLSRSGQPQNMTLINLLANVRLVESRHLFEDVLSAHYLRSRRMLTGRPGCNVPSALNPSVPLSTLMRNSLITRARIN